MHNAAFTAVGFNGVYAAIRVKDIRPAAAGMRSLGLRGASVTLPHKETVMACLDYIDPTARRIKAVNTIVNEDGTMKGFNPDCAGALQALAEKTPVAGRQVAGIGAGGAARAVAYGVLSNGGKVCLFNRSREKREAVASELGADFRLLADFAAERTEILVNTTPVGMPPQVEQSPVPREQLRPGMVVMDIVYHPLIGPVVKCHQVCIQYDAKRRLYGAQLVAALEDYAETGKAARISLRCGFDLEANDFWSALGYKVIQHRAGGVRRMRTINVWEKQECLIVIVSAMNNLLDEII